MTYLLVFSDNFREHPYWAARPISGVGLKPFRISDPIVGDITLVLARGSAIPILARLKVVDVGALAGSPRAARYTGDAQANATSEARRALLEQFARA